MFNKRLSLTGITASFSKVLKDLEALKAQNKSDIATKTTKVSTLNTEIASHQSEHDNAHAIHTNISALLTVKK